MQNLTLAFVLMGCLAVIASAEPSTDDRSQLTLVPETANEAEDGSHSRVKRTLFLKKKLLGAGLLGFGLGVAKGYKFGYHTAPEVHHVYLAPPPPPPAVKYVEYIEKPVYRYVEKPVFKPPHHDYEPSSWSQQEPSPTYGQW